MPSSGRPVSLEAQFLADCLDLEAATGVEGARWEAFQLVLLNDESPLRLDNKSRQIAWSWTASARSVARAVLRGRSSIFVSINLDEAKEKVRYARDIYRALASPFGLPRLTRDNELGLEFEGGTRILSLPAKPPRGKARFDVYLDEFAHARGDREIYRGALPIISKGGTLRIGSSPLGASGLFWEIDTESMRRYPGYRRGRLPWWEVQAFCRDVTRARSLAPALETFERVEHFGKEAITVIFDNMPLEDFQQEYECAYVDEASAWITWEEIRASYDAELACTIARSRAADLAPARAAIDALSARLARREIEPVLGAGVDVGRTRNATELFIGGRSTAGSYPLRAAVTLESVEFDDQEDLLTYALTQLPIAELLIDRTGIGMNLAERLARRFRPKVRGVDFTNETKRLWATDAKMLIQQGRTPLPVDREIAYQIHSIKRQVTPAKNLVFDTERNEKHHADKFWAWALMLQTLYQRPRAARPRSQATDPYQ